MRHQESRGMKMHRRRCVHLNTLMWTYLKMSLDTADTAPPMANFAVPRYWRESPGPGLCDTEEECHTAAATMDGDIIFGGSAVALHTEHQSFAEVFLPSDSTRRRWSSRARGRRCTGGRWRAASQTMHFVKAFDLWSTPKCFIQYWKHSCSSFLHWVAQRQWLFRPGPWIWRTSDCDLGEKLHPQVDTVTAALYKCNV